MRKAKNIFQKHQEKISIRTLKMNPAMLAVMGGQTTEEAKAFLKSIGYTEAEIERIQ